jgi:hypothetical protein
LRHQYLSFGQYVGNLLDGDNLISKSHHDESIRLLKEQIMRLEFDKEDLKQEVEWWKKLVHPSATQREQEFKPIFNRNSIGRARVLAEMKNKDIKK